MSGSFEKATVGDIVATDFRAGAVFERFGIDFCCGGRRSMAEACEQAAVDPAAVEQALRDLPAAGGPGDDDVTRWPVDRLIDHIITTHHGYVRRALPTVAKYLAKIVEVHGSRHPELARVAAAFSVVSADLTLHMLKEERVLFPFMQDLASAEAGSTLSCPFGSIENPIRMMEREHREAGDELRFIRELTNDYTPPEDACITYRACYAELEDFERDLHRHVHLENNVLFPKALELEREHAIFSDQTHTASRPR